MAFEVDGIRYYSKAEAASLAGISRQTFYRWIKEAKIPPPGQERKRDGRLFYSQSELDQIQAFANQVEPVDQTASNQLRLFSGIVSGEQR